MDGKTDADVPLQNLPFGVFVQGQHGIIFPGIAIALAVLSVNFIGDGLRDALDPRRRL